MTLNDLDGVVAEFLRSEPERSSRARWARRWFWKIDRTVEIAEAARLVRIARGEL